MLGMHIDLIEMSDSRLEHLDLRKSNRNIVRKGHPEMTLSLRLLKIFLTGRLSENRFWRVPRKEPGGGELYRRQQREILRPRRGDLVR